MKKIFLSLFFMSAFLFVQAEVIDLNGEAKTLTSSELSSEFTNTSETLTELTLDVPQNATNTFSGKLSGNIKLVKTGKGTLNITTVNDFTGGVALQAGVINFTVAGSLGNGLITISASSTLQTGAAVECANPIHLLASSSTVKSTNASSAFCGDITGEPGITFTPNSNKHITFRGAITIENGTLQAAKTQEKYSNFYGPVNVKIVSGVSSGNASALRFFNANNSWQYFTFKRYGDQAWAPAFVAYAIPENSYVNHQNNKTTTRGFEVSGDQKFRYLTSSTPALGAAGIKATAPSTVTLGSEVEWTGKQNSTAYLFEGSLSLVYLPEQNESEWKIESGSSTMNGSITVSKGIFSIAKTVTFKNVPSICVSAGATFNLGNSTNALKGLTTLELGAGARFNASEAVTPFADNKITFDVAQDSVIEISPDLELSALVFKVNGTPIKGGGWYTGQDNPSPGNATPFAQLSGTGRIYLPLQVAEETTSSWNGEGGENERMGNAANWAGNTLPDFSSGGFLPTLVESGNKVIVDGAYILRGLYLTAPESTLTLSSDPSIANASLALHKDGIEIAPPPVDETRTYELKTPTKLLINQCWTVPAGTSLDIYEPIIADNMAQLYKDGAGDLNLYATNTFTGDMIISNGAVRVYSETNAFGAAGGTVTLRQRNGATLNILTNTVIDKDFIFSNEKNKNGWVKMESGTVCKFLRSFTCSDNWRPDFGSGATVIFGGGGKIGNYFVPAGGNMIFAGKPFSFGAGFNLEGGSIDFQVGGNTFHSTSGYTINGGHTSYLSAENVFEASTPVILGGGNNSACILSIRNGANQRMGNLKMSKANSVVTAVEPAELTVNLTENITWAGNFTGGLTLIKDGAMTGTIDRVVGSTGDVHVVSGALVFGANGSWLGAKKVVDSDAVLSLSNKDTFASTIILETSGNAVIEIPEGVDIKVAEWIHNGTPCAPNYYAAANGKGVVSGSGTMLVGMPALMILIK